MKIGKTLQNLRTQLGYSQREVAEQLTQKGYILTQGALSNWEVGRREPDLLRFFALCDFYGVQDIRYTFTGVKSDSYDPLAGLNENGKWHAKQLIDMLYTDPQFTQALPDQDYKIIRLYDIPVSAGSGMFLEESSYTELMLDKDKVPRGTDFAVRARGDSMEPAIYDGQILFIKKREYVEEGEIGIFSLNGDAYCKRMEKGQLISLNKKYPPIALGDDDRLAVFGKVLL